MRKYINLLQENLPATAPSKEIISETAKQKTVSETNSDRFKNFLKENTISIPHLWSLDHFTQGYIHDLLLEYDDNITRIHLKWENVDVVTARRIINDCKKFQAENVSLLQAIYDEELLHPEEAGKCFLQSRNKKINLGFASKRQVVINDLGVTGERLDKAARKFGPFEIKNQEPLNENMIIQFDKLVDSFKRIRKYSPPIDGARIPSNELLRSSEFSALHAEFRKLGYDIHMKNMFDTQRNASYRIPDVPRYDERNQDDTQKLNDYLDHHEEEDLKEPGKHRSLMERLRELETKAFALGKKFGVNGLITLVCLVHDIPSSLPYSFETLRSPTRV